MEIETTNPEDELRLGELLAALWNSKLLIAAVTTASVVLGGVAYLLVPRTFESTVSVFPLRQTQFARYLALSHDGSENSQEGSEKPDDRAFAYTSDTLHAEFLSYVKDADRLTAIAMETGLVERGALTDEAYRQAVRRFVSQIRFEEPDIQSFQAGQRFLNVRARADNPDKLAAFMQKVLADANKDMAHDLAIEVSERAAEIKERFDAKAAKLQVDIDAHRKRIENDRNDEMIRVGEQSMIAHALGIEKPLALHAIEAAGQGSTAPVQINANGNQPPYLQGYAALDERIKILQDRKSNDPFTEDLREIQQRLYAIQNDPRPARILALLKRSPLANPETASMVRFSLLSADAQKVFPRLSVFGTVSLFFGFLLGSAIALIRRLWN
ncbi:Wzz/FepE/Etk N-terminal domain-containing protein [Mesorhizobium sp. NPDC059054]|uniref:Wzz/FepE/Etk N-terminal domain-containing protein n=1 Tax=Mesorhizobium sp. NPDC059054 TaxID=3346711 RepID=UPI0036C7EB96